ncbi:MAG: hypothetical protein ACEQSE_08845, partial [Candidatus Aquirickettsiella gammari]
MNFFGKLISGGKNKSDNLSPNKLLKSIAFDLKDCELLVDKEYELGWLNIDTKLDSNHRRCTFSFVCT